MAGLVPAIHAFFWPQDVDAPGPSSGMTGTASFLRRRYRNQHGHDIVAAVDDLAAFVRPDEAAIVGLEHGLLAAGDQGELAREHVINLFRGRSVGPGAAAGH